MEVLGIKRVSFKAKDGNLIQGIKVFVSALYNEYAFTNFFAVVSTDLFLQ